MNNKKYLGIDLGTSNSSVAVFSDGKASIVLNEFGQVNTPSIVHVTESKVVVGKKAQRTLLSDPLSTFKEFKRSMGSTSTTAPDFNNKCWTPEELSAEVLKNLKTLAENHEECEFDKTVITVPALFEIPQCNATSNSGRLANFAQVELLPEPVASALASGWDDGHTDVAWLVYDLGGGTFDVSLLESRDGLLRVVAHDGDNFLGGRDIDALIVEWVKTILVTKYKVKLDKQANNYQLFQRHIEIQVEQAKIRLSDTTQTIIEVDSNIGNDRLQIDIPLDRNQLNAICQHLIQRSIDICLSLIKQQGLPKERLEKVVLVGGPAHMAIIKDLVSDQLAAIAESATEPMSLVAKGAAIYAATIDLACLNENLQSTNCLAPHHVWLQYPSICSELDPNILGKIIDESFTPKKLILVNYTESWESIPVQIDQTGMFIFDAKLNPREKNIFFLKGFDKKGNQISVNHAPIEITHGITVSDPPLSRSIGVALADGWVKTFIDRGTPLPAKRSFTQSTVETLIPRANNELKIPVVQGERQKVRFCRNVGNLVIRSIDIKTTLPVGSSIEITISVDRGGNLNAQAYIPEQGVLIDSIAKLNMSHQSLEEIRTGVTSIAVRLDQLLKDAFRERNEGRVNQLTPLSSQLQYLTNDIESAVDNVDMCQRLSRNLIELEADLEHIEKNEHIQMLIDEAEQQYFKTRTLVEEFGDSTDKRILEQCSIMFERAVTYSKLEELERLIERLSHLLHSAHRKSPEYWTDAFRYCCSLAHYATNLKKANILIERGKSEVSNSDPNKLRITVNELFALIPPQYHSTADENYESGVY